MGLGIEYRCSKCDQQYEVSLGFGFLYRMTYKNVVDEIHNGKYGQELKDLMNSTDNVAVDAVETLFYCSECGSWEVLPDLSLYIACNDIAIEDVKQGSPVIPTIERKDFPQYRLLKKYDHICPKCNKPMQGVNDNEYNKLSGLRLSCPKCSGELNCSSAFHWD